MKKNQYDNIDIPKLEQDFRDYLSSLNTDYMTSGNPIDIMLLAAIVDARNINKTNFKKYSIYSFRKALIRILDKLDKDITYYIKEIK
jgi:hypothetical protein